MLDVGLTSFVLPNRPFEQLEGFFNIYEEIRSTAENSTCG